MISNILGGLCGEEIPTFIGLFDLSTPPELLYYSYIPTAIISLIFGFFVWKNNQTLIGRLVLILATSFFFWVFFDLIQWIASYHSIIKFAWEINILFEITLFFSGFYLLYVLLNKKDLSFITKLIMGIMVFIVSIGAFTPLHINSYNYKDCEGVLGQLGILNYFFEALIIIGIVFISTRSFNLAQNKKDKKVSLFLGLATFLLFFIFWSVNVFSQIVNDYTYLLLSPIGMAIFIIIISFVIIKYNLFNIKLFSAQILSFSIISLSGSQLFFTRTTSSLVISVITFIMISVISYFLLKNIKTEIQIRKKIQDTTTKLKKLNTKLKRSNELRAKFLSIASHQFRSPVTAIKGYTELMLDGTYGSLNSEIKEPIKRLFVSSSNLALIVNDFLNLSRIDSDSLEYNMKLHNLKDVVDTAVSEQQSIIKMREDIKLIYDKGASRDNFNTVFDVGMVKQVITNLIDNAIKYTVAGEVRVTLEKDDEKNVIRFKVKDSGIGIPADSIGSLFSQFTRASNANKVNVMGTGLGLYIAKEIIKAHNGAIWAESEGDDKGSTFIVELPIVTQVQDSDSGQV